MSYQLAVVGGGAMGEALVAGAIKSGQYQRERIIVSDPLEARRNYFHEHFQVRVTGNNEEAVKEAATIVMAVKPQVYLDVLKPLAPIISPKQLLISVAAGITISNIEGALMDKVPVIRVMPNTPCLVGKGATVIARGNFASAEHMDTAEKLFGALGYTTQLPEASFSGVTALSGSGPAYVFLMLEALIEGGVRVGLPRELSKALVLQTMAGAVEMVVETGKHPAVLKEMVTSPGGTTAAALEYLETEGIRGTLIKAVAKAWERAQELSSSKE